MQSQINSNEDDNKIRKRGGNIVQKYFTDEERKIADREKTRRYYQRNKEEIKRKQMDKYAREKNKIKIALEIYQKYTDGKLIENN
jgi:hypothetical protein